MTKEALQQACDNVGGQTALAKMVGRTQGHISTWLRRNYLPAELVLPIEAASGVSRHDLRPDLYPREGEAA